MPPSQIITTPRLFLHSTTPSMVHDLFVKKTKEEIMAHFGTTEAGYERLLMMHQQGMEAYRLSLHFFRIRLGSTGETIGECGFHSWNKPHRRAELYYSLNNDSYKQKGYMKEALPFVINFGFTEMQLHRIQAMVDKNNLASIKLLNRFGFKFEGTMREDYSVNGKNEDSDCYSLLSQEWKMNPENIIIS